MVFPRFFPFDGREEAGVHRTGETERCAFRRVHVLSIPAFHAVYVFLACNPYSMYPKKSTDTCVENRKTHLNTNNQDGLATQIDTPFLNLITASTPECRSSSPGGIVQAQPPELSPRCAAAFLGILVLAV